MNRDTLRATAAMIQTRWPGRWEGDLARRLEQLTTRIQEQEKPMTDQECTASISGHCLAESQSETACDTDAGECVHGGKPATLRDRITAIHQPVAGEGGTQWCQVCSQEEIQPQPVGWWVPWPCPTMQAVAEVLPAPADRAAEEHRLALSDALGLGTGAPWDAICDRATELALPPLDRDPVAQRLGLVAEHRATVLREAADYAEATAETLRAQHEFGRSTGALDVMTVLRRLADETQQAETDPLAVARATNQRLNLRAQQLESELAVYRGAVAQWEISDGRTYVPLRTLAAIAKAAGRNIETPQWLQHYQRVEQAEAVIERVSAVVPFAEQVAATSGPGPASAVWAVADRLRAALGAAESETRPEMNVAPLAGEELTADEAVGEPLLLCCHTEPGSPCDWDVCRQPERLAAGDHGTDPGARHLGH